MGTHQTFVEKYQALSARRGPLCLGIDPSDEVLSAWGQPHSPTGLANFIEQLASEANEELAIVKPQSAYFERFGHAGVKILHSAVKRFQEQGSLVLLDAKRGDILDTNKAYADAALGSDYGLDFDAVTTSPYLGVGALLPLFRRARQRGKYVFVLAAPSNEESLWIQEARVSETRTVAEAVCDEVRMINDKVLGTNVGGVVIGMTDKQRMLSLASRLGKELVLSPGLGVQGGTLDSIKDVPNSSQIIPTLSRSILLNGSLDTLKQFKSEARRAVFGE